MLAATTKLDAVNILLGSIGEATVNAVIDEGLSDAAVASRMLDRITRKIQTKGPRCSVEQDFPLVPDAVTGEIKVSTNIINVKGLDPSRDVVLRGRRLYDKTNHTYKFTESIQADVTWLLDFDELPEHVREVIVHKAAHSFQKEVLGSDKLYAFTKEEVDDAWAEFTRKELNNDDLCMLDSPGVRDIINRRI